MSALKLLSVGNTKTRKGEAWGYRTYILHLAPALLSGYNVCPMASKGCAAACLNTAGRGIMQRVQAARIRKTKLFFEDRDTFMHLLVKDIQTAIRHAIRHHFIPVFRLNGTSDIRWENIPVGNTANIMELFPFVQFYDYTKLANRKNLPANYHLTFSRSESNETEVQDIISQTLQNIAVVFNVKKHAPLPVQWNGREVIDGDISDLRFLDKHGIIVGLRGKGKAKQDTSNFTVNV